MQPSLFGFRALLTLMAVVLVSPSAQAGSEGASPSMIDVLAASNAEYEYQPLSVTSAALEEAMRLPGTEVRRASDAEARAAAHARGIELPEVPADSPAFGRPWFIVKMGIGLPTLIGADVEVYVHDHWTVEGGVGFGVAGLTFMGAVRWRPEATCFGCKGRNVFSIGFGIETHVGFPGDSNLIPALLVGSADAFYLHRFARHFGWVIGLKLGAGATTDFRRSNNEAGSTGLKVEPAIVFLLYTGFQF